MGHFLLNNHQISTIGRLSSLTHLSGDLSALLSWHLATDLLGNSTTLLLWHLGADLLGYVLALHVGGHITLLNVDALALFSWNRSWSSTAVLSWDSSALLTRNISAV